ncbi:MAG: hypothetical protein Q8Q05_03865 [bacterium]|nr:hypothetical protein [bacterium]
MSETIDGHQPSEDETSEAVGLPPSSETAAEVISDLRKEIDELKFLVRNIARQLQENGLFEEDSAKYDKETEELRLANEERRMRGTGPLT